MREGLSAHAGPVAAASPRRLAVAAALATLLAVTAAAAQDFPVDPDAPTLEELLQQESAPEPEPEPAPRPPPPPEPEPEPEPEYSIPPWPPESVGPPALLPAGNPASEEFVGPPLVPPFQILGSEVMPGHSARLEWRASQSFAGSEVISPVIVTHGVRPGPVLCLTAAVHGDEINGIEIVRRVMNQVDPAALSGTMIGVPIVNLFGFGRGTRYLPDRRDLNRYFPGTRYGSIASRIAHSFFDGVVRHCEALVDFHTGSFDRDNLPQVRADLTIPEVLEFTRGFGDTPVLHSDGSRGMLRVAATQAGIPAVTFEIGAPARLQPEEIRYGVRAIESLLHNLGMGGEGRGSGHPQAVFYNSRWIRSDAGGMLIADVELGDRVERGQVLGRVIDPLSNTEREILSPLHGRVIGMAQNQIVLPGFAAFHLGEETSEQGAVREAATTTGDPEVEEDGPPPDADGLDEPETRPEEEDEFE